MLGKLRQLTHLRHQLRSACSANSKSDGAQRSGGFNMCRLLRCVVVASAVLLSARIDYAVAGGSYDACRDLRREIDRLRAENVSLRVRCGAHCR